MPGPSIARSMPELGLYWGAPSRRVAAVLGAARSKVATGIAIRSAGSRGNWSTSIGLNGNAPNTSTEATRLR